ncbi:hypothetical protein MUN81_10440 [Hymenobacter sp. 5317J-9]|uniref:hypothetical protein n=1 Tax=Hymenobacter sp. 5317J-9 TaxID=2932250 RepID=UPI001FD6A5C1|nr:hypothetical protein [Hymenobacter sp. 5317J-9]UOQ99897.1 hypothetical protein MUN81_10440 [Hymenobacter sp. 5317J-9]
MELAAITAWLASARPFAQGVALYAQVGTNATYQRLFALGESDYSAQVLARELRAMVGEVKEEIAALANAAPPPEPPAAALPTPAPVVPNTPVGVGSPALAQVRAQLRAVRDERSQAHAQLTARNLGKKARYAVAARILELTDQEVKLKEAEAHVLAHGRLPGPVPTAEIDDAGVLRQRLTNLLSLRSKLKKRPDRADDLAAAEAEIILIRSKLHS